MYREADAMCPGDMRTWILTGQAPPVHESSTTVKSGLAVQEKSCTSSEWNFMDLVPSGLLTVETKSPAAPTISFCGRVRFTSKVPKSAKNSESAWNWWQFHAFFHQTPTLGNHCPTM